MRVCMVAYSFYEIDNRVMRYSETLARRGDNVDVIALRKPGQKRFERLRGVNIYRIQTRVSKDKRPRYMYLVRLLGFLGRSTLWLTGLHLRHSYSVVHVHSVPDFEVFAAFVPRLSGCKVILDIHDIVPELYSSKFGAGKRSKIFKLLVWVERRSIAFANHVIIANHYWREKLIERSTRANKCSVIMNYPDRNIFFESSQRRKDNKFVLMYPGTLNYHQGVDIAINAFSRIVNEIPEAVFYIYGDGPEKANLKTLAARLGLEERVLFRDFVPLAEIGGVMSHADIGIVPKRNDSFGDEAFSTKSLEFMAVGVPLLISATKIDRYYFNSSVVEFFNCNDATDLAKKILLLYKNPERRRALAENGKKLANLYDWRNRKREYLELLARLLLKKETCFVKKEGHEVNGEGRANAVKLMRFLYYLAKPLIPRAVQIGLRRIYISWRMKNVKDFWPINSRSAVKPKNWPGWPSGKRFAFILTHDVESSRGTQRVLELASLEKALGFRSSYNFVPGKYFFKASIREELIRNGFEVGVHDLRHDGRLYSSWNGFKKKAATINRYLEDWKAVGFRSAFMFHELDWLHELNIQYDLSTFDTDPFEPQPDGFGSIFPRMILREGGGEGYVEIPYTLPQDLTVFVLLRESDTRIWDAKLDWLVRNGGMVLLNTHPDYMCWEGGKKRVDEYPAELYLRLLERVKKVYHGEYWNVLPRELAEFWKRNG